MRNSSQLFAEAGNPLATPDDWMREVALAQDPIAPSRAKEQALDYVRPHTPYVRPTKLHPRDYPVVDAERIALMQTQRDNLKLALRRLDELTPKPMIAEAKKPTPLPRAEPGFAPVPKPKTKTLKQRQAEHREWTRQRRLELLARDMGITIGELKEKLA